jgi:NhaP-type Na+/H+ or K+/H+ antiporter
MKNDLLGDPFEPTNHGSGKKQVVEEHAEEHADTHAHVALLFFFIALMAGAMILHMLELLIPFLPYTVALFIAGCGMGMTHEWINSSEGWTCWWHSVEMWESIDPHMFFYGFLPSLIFGEAMRLNAQMVSECFWQIMILACPGVLIGTIMTATFAVYVLPYGWDWPIALVFGSISSATDPVAVVALFNTLGVSPRLTMLISGESLLNDGTAMVIFSLMLKVTLGATLDTVSVLTFITHMTVTSIFWGVICGSLAVFIIGLCAEEKQHSDLLIQIVVTMACGYMAFFIAESELSTSGILATVSSGFIIAVNGWPRFVSRESMETLWETIEFVGNTIVFFIAGLLFVFNVMMRREYITFADVGWLLLLYIFLILSRAFMVLLLWPFMNMAGAPLSSKEAMVMVWSGLRGAVGLAMAIIVDREPAVPTQMGSRVMFHIGGLAALTTIINATTSAPLLRFLDLTRTTEMKQRCLSMISMQIAGDIRRSFVEKMSQHDDVRCDGASAALVCEMVPALQKDLPMHPSERSPRRKDSHDSSPSRKDSRDGSNRSSPDVSPRQKIPMNEMQKTAYQNALAEIYRRTFLQVVKTHYWEAIEEGMLPKSGRAARVLLESVDEALGQVDVCLSDWAALEQKIDVLELKKTASFISRMAEKWPFYLLRDFRSAFSRESKIELIVYVALTFMEVHCRAQREMPTLFPGAAISGTEEDSLDKIAEQQVLQESQRQYLKAQELLTILPNTDVQVSRSKLFARELLQLQSNRLAFMKNKGFLTDMEVLSLEHEIHKAIRKLLHSRNREWLALKARAEIREESQMDDAPH